MATSNKIQTQLEMVEDDRWESNDNKIDTCDYVKDILEVADTVGYVVYVN